jgi:hypothetical protein
VLLQEHAQGLFAGAQHQGGRGVVVQLMPIIGIGQRVGGEALPQRLIGG